jgi:hypothetical protein
MTITNGYTDLSTMKGADVLNISSTDTTSDTILEIIVEAASRTIDSDCIRYFYKSSTDETKYYTAQFVDKLFLLDDVVSITQLATDSGNDKTYTSIWSASADYELAPYNAASMNRPYTAIEISETSNYMFTTYRKSIKITGIFGWPSVPAKIKQACVMLSSRLFKRLSTPLGVASMAALGEIQISIKDKDADYFHLINEFVRKI